MKIICTSDWHLGNLFHGNDRLPEHRHFMAWLLSVIKEEQPDALLISGDIFDNGNPSAASQAAYYEFLADATQTHPQMIIIIIAGNHDSANRLEAPRALLSRHKVEIRGTIQRSWHNDENGGFWQIDYDDMMIPIEGKDGMKVTVLAVPYLRSDVVQNASYSKGVNAILRELITQARDKYPDSRLVMMAHMYASGADIAKTDASEKLIIGGQEEVSIEGWTDHPDFLTCGHIHKRQHIWNTNWARYSGSVLPMSFAEKDYHHGVDMVTFECGNTHPNVVFLEYHPQHKLMFLPSNDEELKTKELEKLINSELQERKDGKLDENFPYLVLKVKLEKVSNDDIKSLEALILTKNAVLCKIQKIISASDIQTISGTQRLQSIDDILNRAPLDTLKEAFEAKYEKPMSEHQEQMLKDLINSSTDTNSITQ